MISPSLPPSLPSSLPPFLPPSLHPFYLTLHPSLHTYRKTQRYMTKGHGVGWYPRCLLESNGVYPRLGPKDSTLNRECLKGLATLRTFPGRREPEISRLGGWSGQPWVQSPKIEKVYGTQFHSRFTKGWRNLIEVERA